MDRRARQSSGLKHFMVTGVLCAIGLGWLATLVVNNAIGVAVDRAFGFTLTDYYLGALLTTVVSISLISLCILIGNRWYRRLMSSPLRHRDVFDSTALFSVFVLIVVLPQIEPMLSHVTSHLSWAYRHSEEVLLVLSLPIARLVLLPTIYYFVSSPYVDRSSGA